ncbi:hypothetical protein [Bacillus mojavensis]
MNIPNFCPNCGNKSSVTTGEVSSAEHYYSGNTWLKTRHSCNNCLANFVNYDNGSTARKEAKKLEEQERAELARLKAKYEEG